jgi:hypothetical protein
MAKTSDTAQQLEKLVQQLQEERQHHVEAIDEIDSALGRLGIEPTRRAGRPRKKTKTTKKAKTTGRGRGRGRGRYTKTAEQFILDLLEGGKEMTTSEINQAWRKAGRPGDAATTLTKLSKQGKIKRENIPGARGSKYKLA